MTRNISILLSVIVLFGLGCASRQAKYVPEGTPIPGKADMMTIYDLEYISQQLVGKILENPEFNRHYDVAKKANGGELPVIAVMPVDNKTTEGYIRERCPAVRDFIRSRLFTSARFRIKDDDADDAKIARIIYSADKALEDGKLNEYYGSHLSPDFMVLTKIRHFSDEGGFHTYLLNISIHSLKTGETLCECIQKIIKK